MNDENNKEYLFYQGPNGFQTRNILLGLKFLFNRVRFLKPNTFYTTAI